MKPYILAAGAAVTILLAACGSSEPMTNEPAGQLAAPSTAAAPTTAAAEGAAGIEIKDFKYAGTLTVKPGEEVAVKNVDTAPHTVTDKAKAFDTGKIDGGASGKFTAPDKAGSYPITCIFHPNMAGTLIVQ